MTVSYFHYTNFPQSSFKSINTVELFMKHILTLLLLLYFHAGCFCQQENPEFGKISMIEMQLNGCDFEKGAAALKLYKFEETELVSDEMTTKTERWERIKIFSPAGYSFANIEIPFSKQNKIKNISAIIYNLDENNRIVTQKIGKDEIYKKSENKKKGSLVFTFPGLKPGSVVEYKFTEVEKEASRYDVKFFQDRIPVQLCVFKIIMPDYMDMDLSFIGETENTEKIREEKTPVGSHNTETIIRKNILSFQKEPYMSSVSDNLQHMIIKFVRSVSWKDSLRSGNGQGYYTLQWSSLSTTLRFHPFFGQQIQKPITGTSEIIDSAKALIETSKIVDFIYRKVKNKIKWNDYQMIYAEDLERAWKTGLGSDAEINFIILNLLKDAGVNCYPILVRRKEYGKASRTFYSLRQFSSVNVLVFDSLNYYVLNGAEKFLSYKTLPYQVLNRDVFLVDDFKSEWLTIIDPRPFLKKIISAKVEIDSSGNLMGDAFISHFDYAKNMALTEREKKSDEKEDDEVKFLKTRSDDIKIDSLIEDFSDESKPFNQNFHFRYTPEIASGYIYLDPLFLSPFRKNPFIESTRQTDIDFGSNQFYSVMLHITIPENFIIEGTPKNQVIIANDSSMTFKRQTIQQDNILIFKYSFEINRAIFSKEEYIAVREYFKKVYGAVQEQIIIRKK